MSLGTEERPLRVAVVGSGPSGFYAAEALLKNEAIVDVDLFERLPVPFGLVRYGVAPDHAKIKNVTRVYDRTAGNERFRFLGNVDIGKDVSIEELQTYYDAIILTVGAQTDRKLGIPGEDLPGSYTATEFVAWYNGHPDYVDHDFNLNAETAVIIGQGNVAIDVARILAKTVDELKTTDIAAHALDALSKSAVKDIYLVGRRGPAQAAFTVAEIKEMGELEDCDIIIVGGGLAGVSSAYWLAKEDPSMKVALVEKDHIMSVYNLMGKNKSRTARSLGIGLNTLRRKLESYGIT